jgi:hypothetical protein
VTRTTLIEPNRVLASRGIHPQPTGRNAEERESSDDEPYPRPVIMEEAARLAGELLSRARRQAASLTQTELARVRGCETAGGVDDGLRT